MKKTRQQPPPRNRPVPRNISKARPDPRRKHGNIYREDDTTDAP